MVRVLSLICGSGTDQLDLRGGEGGRVYENMVARTVVRDRVRERASVAPLC